MRERFAHLRAMGIKTVMITGDNPLTAAAIASEAGVDDFLAQATPEDKMTLIRREQAEGKLVAMTGDGTNDAPALAQADVGVAMNTGTTAAKEAGNMVDLDSNPTKLIEIVEIGKQLLMTRGALTTFSIANDVAKYFAIIPAMFILAFPQLGVLNVMRLATPESAILSAVIFNAVIIIALIPLALQRHRLQAARRGGDPAAQPADLRPRRCRPAVRRHQGHRHRAGGDRVWRRRSSSVRARCPTNVRRPTRCWPASRSRIARACASTSAPRRASARPTRCCRRRTPSAPGVSTWSSASSRPTAGATPRRSSRTSRSSRAARSSIAASRWRRWTSTPSCARKPQVCVVDELAHTNVPGSRHAKRYEDVLEILDAGIHVMTAVNIQHLETLNDAVARATGVRVRETVPDTFLDRADEVINVDVTVEELRNRLREGKIYRPEKVEQALSNFFRKGNLSTLRELALRAVADEVGEKAASYRAREGLEPALIPERVMVCMSSNALAPRVIRTGARIAGRLGSRWYAVYVETPRETARSHQPARRRGAAAEHQARREPRRDGRAGEGRQAGRRPDRVRAARGRHARDLRPERAFALGAAAGAVRRSTGSSAPCRMRPCRSCR